MDNCKLEPNPTSMGARAKQHGYRHPYLRLSWAVAMTTLSIARILMIQSVTSGDITYSE